MSEILAYPVPTKGLNTNQEPTKFSDAFSPFMKNAYAELTKVRKRRGISQVGAVALPLPGVGTDLITYVDAVGSRHEIAVTTTSAFEYNGTHDSWDDITPGVVLANGSSNWTDGASAASADSVSADNLIITPHFVSSPPSSAAIFIDCVADVSDGDLLAYIALTGATDVTAYTEIRLWVYPKSTGLSANSLEIVVTEEVNGAKGGTEVISAVHAAAPADTWTRLAFTVDMATPDIDGAQSVSVYANHATEFDGTDTTEFSHNSGTALCICNGVDDIYYYEGQSNDRFQLLVHGSSASTCRLLSEFWNHMMLIHPTIAVKREVKTLLYAAAGDVDDHASDNAGANTLTDTIGALLAAVKLGSALILYSEDSITVGRYYGGLTIFTFPTLVFGTGIMSTKSVAKIASVHIILGSDQKVYAYYGDTDLVPVGEFVDDSLFTTLDVSKKQHIASGVDRSKYKVHFLLPRSGAENYANFSYCFNYRSSMLSWETHDFSKTIRGFGSIQAGFNWYCDEDPLKDVYCDESALYCDDGSGQTDYEVAAFISDDGYVYQLDEVTGQDDSTDITFDLYTPEFIVNEEEQYGRWTWFSFQALSSVVDSTLVVQYSTNSGSSWTELTGSPVNLNQEWTTHRLPLDVVNRRIMFRLYQASDKDVQLRGLFKCKVEPQTARD